MAQPSDIPNFRPTCLHITVEINGETVSIAEIIERYELPFHLAIALSHLLNAEYHKAPEHYEPAIWFIDRWKVTGCHYDNPEVVGYPLVYGDLTPLAIIQAFDAKGDVALVIERILLLHTHDERPIPKFHANHLIGLMAKIMEASGNDQDRSATP